MSSLRTLISRLLGAVGLRHRDQELREEIESHIDSLAGAFVSRGLPPAEARAAARREFGGIEQIKEAYRDQRGLAWVDTLGQDLRYGIRQLRRSPGFTVAAILSLALGVGANMAIFQLINAVRFRNLPISRPEQLVDIRIAGGTGGWGISDDENSQITYPIWEQIRDHQRAFSGIFAWGTTPFLVGSGGDAQVVRGLYLSGDAFTVLGLAPAAGRLLNSADDRRGCSPSVVLNYAFWQGRFGADPTVVGRTLTVLNRPVPIIGVTPPDFFGLDVGKRFDIALPTCAAAVWGNSIERRDYFWLSAMGRLKPGWTIATAADHLRALSVGVIEATLPTERSAESLEKYRAFRFTAAPAGKGARHMDTVYGRTLWLLLAMTGLVLLMACTNLANLLLARAHARAQEIATRLALGASRARIIRQLLTESVPVVTCGMLLALLIAPQISRGLVALLTTEGSPLHLDLRLDWAVLAFMTAASSGTYALFGLAPALWASRLPLAPAVKAGGRGLTASRDRTALPRTLVTAQVALSLVLIVAAGLFVRSFRNLMTLDSGVTREGVIFARFADFSTRLTPNTVAAAQRELLERIRSASRVDAAAATTKFPLDNSSWSQGFTTSASAERRVARFTYVSSRYFETVGMRLIAGRDFTEGETAQSRRVALVNENFVRRYLAPRAPIGVTLRTTGEPGFPETVYEIIGVVSDAKYQSLREAPQPIAFVPIAHWPAPRWPNIVLRSSAPTAEVMSSVKRAVAALHPDMAIAFTVFETQVRDGLVREGLLAWLAGGFGVLATVLAAIGIYGVVSYLVLRRRHEVAIRMALGARRAQVVSLLCRELIGILIAGLVIGGAGVASAARAAGSLLFGLSPNDPVTLAGAAGMLAAIAIIACLIPSVQAARIDPMDALRCE